MIRDRSSGKTFWFADDEWEVLKSLIPAPRGFEDPVEVDFRSILNAIFYVQRTGCQWEMLLHDLPPYTTVYGYFHPWQRKGIWHVMHDLVRQQLRMELGKDEQSTVVIADSQSVKTTKEGYSRVIDSESLLCLD